MLELAYRKTQENESQFDVDAAVVRPMARAFQVTLSVAFTLSVASD